MSIKKQDRTNISENDIGELLRRTAEKEGLGVEGISVLERIMHVESEGKVRAAATGRSDALGLWQFIPGTWNLYASKNADINAVTKENKGTKDDPRLDPEQQIIAAVNFMKDNERALTKALGRKPSAGELYLAHFLGSGGGLAKGAIDVIKEANNNPNTPISGFLPDRVINANGYKGPKNRGVRMNLSNGEELLFKDFTVADINNWADGKMNQKPRYNGINIARYKRNEQDVPEALGEMTMTIIEIVAKALSSLIGGAGEMLAGLFSGSSQDNSQLAKIPHKNTNLASKNNLPNFT